MIPVKASSPSPGRATYHHGDLRRTLLDTALRLVAECGEEGFSLREAARQVGVSPAAAYRHFADKPALLAALAAEGHGRMAAAMEQAAARVTAPDLRAQAIAVLEAIGRVYIEFALKNPPFFRLMFGASARDPEFAPDCAPSGHDSYEVLTRALDELVSAGAIPPERRPGCEIAVWSAVHGYATLLVDGGLPITARQRWDAYAVLSRNLLLGMGCDPALLPPAPALWKGPHPHPHHRGSVAKRLKR